MSEHSNTNFPDVLGTITRGLRLHMDPIQYALAVRPGRIHTSHSFELIVVLQNTSDIDVDIVITPQLPARDLARQKNRFATPCTRIVCGLEPAQVGYVAVPIATAPDTQPGPGYKLGINLTIKPLQKKSMRIRTAQGSGPVPLDTLPDTSAAEVKALHELDFSSMSNPKKDYAELTFTVYPPEPARLTQKTKTHAEWISLWTMRDHNDDYLIAKRVWDTAEQARANFTRTTLFMPLLKTTQERFAACQYALLPPEAIFISKLLTLQIEAEITTPTTHDPRPQWPRWFTALCRILIREPALANQAEPLVTRLLYTDLIYDAVLAGFESARTVTGEDFGSRDEMKAYAHDLSEALAHGYPLDFARAYLPLIMGGVIANTRVTMPRERVRETVFVLSKALQKRITERNEDNAFIFDLTTALVDEALDSL